MAITHSYVDYGAGSDALGDGSVGNPWKTLQWAFDHLVRNVTDGNQVNLKAGTAHVNSAALDLTTFVAGGALSATAPLILRGYTSAANDGGIGEIDCNGATMWAAANLGYIILIHLKCHNPGDNNLINWTTGQHRTVVACEFYKGASNPLSKVLVYISTTESSVVGCYVHDAGTGGTGIVCDFTINNYVVNCPTGISNTARCIGNIVLVPTNGAGITGAGTRGVMSHNIVWTPTSTGTGMTTGTYFFTLVYNNIVCGFAGAGGKGISSANVGLLGYNAFYNNTANYNITDQTWFDLTANDVTLAADPFTDAANGDFSLTAAAKAALAAKGWPTSYLGAHASTVPNLNIGPIQLAAAAAGGMLAANKRGNKQ